MKRWSLVRYSHLKMESLHDEMCGRLSRMSQGKMAPIKSDYDNEVFISQTSPSELYKHSKQYHGKKTDRKGNRFWTREIRKQIPWKSATLLRTTNWLIDWLPRRASIDPLSVETAMLSNTNTTSNRTNINDDHLWKLKQHKNRFNSLELSRRSQNFGSSFYWWLDWF